MSHKHHSCSCKHENVKYCATCRVVHCEDCNMEWSQKVNNWYPIYYNAGGYGSNAIPAGNNPEKAQWVAELTKTTCEHK